MKQFVIDAFTDQVFKGNPAAICILDTWLDQDLMQAIAKENNLSETAFAVKKEEGVYDLRWFTPESEIDLCGHATLGTAYVLLTYYEKNLDQVAFDTLSGRLLVKKLGPDYQLDLPAYELKEVEITQAMVQAIGTRPREAYLGRDLLCVFEREEDIRNLKPNLDLVKDLPGLMLQTTAKGRDYDCISRSFGPKLGLGEDPVCGSGHCHIVPYWLDTLRKEEIFAFQASPRSGELRARMEKDRVLLKGRVALYSLGDLVLQGIGEERP